MSDSYISKEAFDEMQEQLDQLKNKRKQIAKVVNEAREQGDLRENAGYHEARKDQSLNEAKITELENKLKHVQIMDEVERPKGIVSLGSKVKYKNLETKDVSEYTVVSEMEANITQRKISETTPVGNALLGAKKGEVVEVNAPMGVFKVKVLEIS